MKQLIVNADDLGLTPAVNRGVVRAFQDGIVTSASLLVTGSAFEDAVVGIVLEKVCVKDGPHFAK